MKLIWTSRGSGNATNINGGEMLLCGVHQGFVFGPVFQYIFPRCDPVEPWDVVS